jgi:hypothetical protein
MRVAVLMLAHVGRVGHEHALKSMQSFTTPPDVSGLFICDMRGHTRTVLRVALDAVATKRAFSVVACVPCPETNAADDAYNDMAAAARVAGFTHGIMARTHEILEGDITAPIMAVDLMQAGSNVRFRPHVDVFVNLERVTFVGPMLAAPVPNVGTQRTLQVATWRNVTVMVQPEMVPRARIVRLMEMTAERLGLLTSVPDSSQTAARYLELQYIIAAAMVGDRDAALAMLSTRPEQGARGWGGADGAMVASTWIRLLSNNDDFEGKSKKKVTSQLLNFAEASLRMRPPRAEAIAMLVSALRDADLPFLSLLLAAAAQPALSAYNAVQTPWMADPSIVALLANEARKSAVVLNMTAAADVFEAHVATYAAAKMVDPSKFGRVAQTATMPSVATSWRPCVLTYNAFTRPGVDPFNLSGEVNVEDPALLKWMLLSLQNAVKVPYGLRWVELPHMLQTCTTRKKFLTLGHMVVMVVSGSVTVSTYRHVDAATDTAAARDLDVDSKWRPTLMACLQVGEAAVVTAPAVMTMVIDDTAASVACVAVVE